MILSCLLILELEKIYKEDHLPTTTTVLSIITTISTLFLLLLLIPLLARQAVILALYIYWLMASTWQTHMKFLLVAPIFSQENYGPYKLTNSKWLHTHPLGWNGHLENKSGLRNEGTQESQNLTCTMCIMGKGSNEINLPQLSSSRNYQVSVIKHVTHGVLEE